MSNHRLRNPLIVLSLVAVVAAACGEEASPPAGASLAPPTVVRVAGTGAGDALSAAPTAEGDGGREISLLPFFGGWVFEVGDGLPALPNDSTGYHFPAEGRVDATEVARIAAVLGVAGEPQAGGPESWYAWRVGPDDGSAPALYVDNDGLGGWYFSGPWAADVVASCVVVEVPAEETEAGGDDARPVEECEMPEPPSGVPSAGEAEARARELLDALGRDPAAMRFETYADDWGAAVTAYPTVDGLQWPIGFGFGFGAEGALQWAGGWLAGPVATGPYPLIGIDEALARLDEQGGWWGYGIQVAGTEDIAVDSGAADSDNGDAVDGAPIEREPMVATLVDVRADLWWAWDVDGSVWLLPAYTFTSSDGISFTVPAVTDEYLILAPTTVEPLPEPPDDDGASGVEPGSPPDAPADLEAFVGSTVTEFTEAAARLGYTTRVARQDGVDLALTMEYSESRVNVAVAGDIVAEILFIG